MIFVDKSGKVVGMKYALFYESSPDVRTLAPLHFAEHKARWTEFAQAGTLLMVGPFSDGTGALAVFTTREAAEDFAQDDPFVRHGVVSDWSVKEWHEAIFNP